MSDKAFNIGVTILLVLIIFFVCVMICAIHENLKPAVEIETYTEGYEITHMTIDRGRGYLSARNDDNAFTITVNGNQFAQFEEGNIIEVEVRVMDDHGKIFKEYSIIGFEK